MGTVGNPADGETVPGWLRRKGVASEWVDAFAGAFPAAARLPSSDPLVEQLAGAVDEFRFTLEDWVVALVRLDHRLTRAGHGDTALERQLGYVHCAAMVGDIEMGMSLSEVVDELYRRHGFAREG